MDPVLGGALIAGVGNVVSGWFGKKGADKTNQINQAEAQKNRDFQERMRNTSWQAGVEDMRAAGLNPALAYSQGGASSPGGSMPAGAENATSSAFQAMQMQKTLQLLGAQVDKTRAEGESASAQAELDKRRKDFMLRSFSADGHHSAPPLNDIMQAEVDSALAGATNSRALAERTRLLNQVLGPTADLANRMGSMLPLITLLANPAGKALSLLKKR